MIDEVKANPIQETLHSQLFLQTRVQPLAMNTVISNNPLFAPHLLGTPRLSPTRSGRPSYQFRHHPRLWLRCFSASIMASKYSANNPGSQTVSAVTECLGEREKRRTTRMSKCRHLPMPLHRPHHALFLTPSPTDLSSVLAQPYPQVAPWICHASSRLCRPTK